MTKNITQHTVSAVHMAVTLLFVKREKVCTFSVQILF